MSDDTVPSGAPATREPPALGVPPKVPPKSLTLRAAPRRILRFKRSVIIGGSAAGALAVSTVAWLALGHHGPHLAAPADQQAMTDRRTPADAVANLPSDYSKVPALGPPLPGDLGRPILERQDQLAGQGGPVMQTPDQQRAEAERQRIAQQAAQAREAGVMVQSAARPATSAAGAADTATAATATPAAADQGNKLALDPEHDQNNQQRKLDFVSHSASDGIYDGHTLQTPASPYEVMAGSIIAASLITGLDSDLPGTVIAQITENVFDSGTAASCSSRRARA